MAGLFDDLPVTHSGLFDDLPDAPEAKAVEAIPEPSMMDMVGSAMNSVRNFATGASTPKKESVLQDVTMEAPAGMTDDVDLAANREARNRSKSPQSVMFTKANATDIADRSTARGAKVLAGGVDASRKANDSGDDGTLLKAKADEFRSIGEWAGDSVAALKQGTLSLAQLPTNIIAPGSMLADTFRAVQADFAGEESETVKAQRALMRKRIDEEDGFFGKYVETLTSLVANPSLGIQEGIKQIPNFIGILGASKLVAGTAAGAVGLAGRASPTLALGEAVSGGAIASTASKLGGTIGGMSAAGGMSAGDAAGSTYDGVMAAKQSLMDANPDYRDLVDNKGMDPLEARKEIATTKARMAALIAAPIGMAFGYGGAEAAMVASGLAKAAGKTAEKQGFAKIVAKELAGENIDEGSSNVIANKQIQTIDPSRKWDEGVAEAMATATLTSGPFAGVAALSESRKEPERYVPTTLNPNLANSPEQRQDRATAAISSAPDTSTAIAAFEASVGGVAQVGEAQADPAIQAATANIEGVLNGNTTGVLPTDPVSLPSGSADATTGVVDATATGNGVGTDTGGLAAAAVGEPRQPASGANATTVTNPIARTSDSDLLSRVPQSTEVANESEAVRNSATGASQGTGNATNTVAAGVPVVGNTAGSSVQQSVQQAAVASRESAQKVLDHWNAKDPATNPKITLGAPDAKADSQIQAAMQQAKALFGVTAEVVAFSDPSPDSVNGIQLDGKVYINTKGLTSNALTTGWHETHHVMQAQAEADTRDGKTNTPAQKYISKVDAIYDSMGEKGKLDYIANFLASDRINASPEIVAYTDSIKDGKGNPMPQKYWSVSQKAKLSALRMEAAKGYLDKAETRKEMMADFVGNRATDREFIKSLAKADPKNFQQWASKWLQTINDLIAELRGGKGNAKSKAVDQYVADLTKAKMVLRDAIVELRRDGTISDSVVDDPDYSRKGVIGEVAPHPVDRGYEQDQSGEEILLGGKKISRDYSLMSDKEKLMRRRESTAQEWDAQEWSEKAAANRNVAQKLFRSLMDMHGLRGWDIDMSTGQYQGKTNPNFIIDAPESATQDQLNDVARELGYILDQQSMVVFDEGNTSGGNQNSFIKVILPEGFPSSKLQELRDLIHEKFPRADANTQTKPSELVFGNFTAFNGESRLSDEEFEAGIVSAVESLEWDGAALDIKEIERYESELIWSDNRGDYLKEGKYGKGNSEQTRSSEGRTILRSEKRDHLVQLRKLARESIGKRQDWIDNSSAGRTRSRVQERALADATQSSAEAERDYGVAREGSVAKVGVHFSQQRRKILSSQFHGSGLNGAERDRAQSSGYIKDRLYFYVDRGNGVTPEAGVGGVKHIIKLNNLYDVSKDHKGFGRMSTGATEQERQTKFENFVKNAGFDGYFMDKAANQDFAVLLGKHSIEMPSYKRRTKSVDDFVYDEDTTGDLGNFNLDAIEVEELDKEDIGDLDFTSPDDDALSALADEAAFRQRMVNRARRIDNPQGPKAVTKESMAQHGIFPERAFAHTFGNPDFNGDSVGSSVGMNPNAAYPHSTITKVGDDQYKVSAAAGWFDNGSNYTKNVAINLFKAHLVRGFIHDSGYDIASAYKKGTNLKIAKAWLELAKAKNAFKYKTSTSTDFTQIGKDLDAFNGYSVSVDSTNIRDATIRFIDKSTNHNYLAVTHFSELSDDDGFAVNTMGLKGSRVGTAVYAVIGQWAKNQKEKFYCDTNISAVNTFRRTEQSFSFAIKTGDSTTLLPGQQNRIYGFDENASTPEEHLMNISRLAIANMRNVMEVLPDTTTTENGSHKATYKPSTSQWIDENDSPTMIGLTRLSLDPETGVFTDSSGKDVTKGIQRWLNDPKNRGTGIGESTLARAVMTNGIIMGKVDANEVNEFAKPIAYARKRIDVLAVEDVEGVAEKGYTKEQKAAALVEKFKRMRDFHNDRDSLLTQIERDATAGKEEAVVLRLIAHTGFRIGGGMSKSGPTYGASTLRPEHVKVTGDVAQFDFIGKSGVQQRHSIKNADIAKDISKRMGGESLFKTADRAVRKYKDSLDGGKKYKVHDFRTWQATKSAQLVVDGMPQPTNEAEFKAYVDLALQAAATKIGDTLATTKEHYVDPQIFDGWRNSAGVSESESEGSDGANEAATSEANDGAAGQGSNEPGVRDSEEGLTGYKRSITSLGGVSTKITAGQEAAFIGKLNQSLLGSGNTIHLVKTHGDLPVNVQQVSSPGDMGITFGRGDVYIVQDNIHSAEDFESTVIHELYGHIGLRALFGPEIYKRLNKLSLSLGESKIAYLVQKYKLDTNGYVNFANNITTSQHMNRAAGGQSEIRRAWLMEEVLSHIAENETGSLRQFALEVVGAIKSWLRDNGFMQLAKLDMADIAHILKQSRVAAFEKSGVVDVPMFKRKGYPAAQGLPEESKGQAIQRVMQDKYNRVKMVQDLLLEGGGVVGEEQDVYRAEERMHGRVHEVLRDFADNVVHPLINKAVEYKVDLNELAAYAYAKHAKERNAHIQKTNQHVKTGSGMSDAEADNIIQLVELSQDAAKFEELHADLLAITSTTRRLMLDEGLITQDQYDGLESQYENYVPLRGFEDVDPDSGSVRPGLGRGFNTKGKETIAAMGRDSKAGDIIENIIRDYERITIRAERNAVGKTFLDLVTSNPDANLWEVQPMTRATRKVNGLIEYVDTLDKGDETISVKVGGEQVYIKINDPLLLRAMQNTFKAETSDAEMMMTKTLGVYTSLLRNTITRYNPVFGLVNAARDAQMGAAAIFDELGAEGLRRYTANYGAAGVASWRVERNTSDPQAHPMDKWMREMRFAGGTTGGVFMRDHASIRQELRDAMLQAGAAPISFDASNKSGVINKLDHYATAAGERARKTTAWWATGKLLHGLELVGSMSENTARLAAYATAREMGKTPAQAASIAKNLTVNFNRFGEQGQLINTAFLFYNASVQGSVRIYQMAKNPKVRYAMAGMASVGMGLALWAASVGGDDEDGQAYWDKIPDFEKERNLIIMLTPGADIGEKVGTHGRYMKFPMAYGLNVFPVLGYQLADLARNVKDPARGVGAVKVAINMLSATAGSYNPAGGSFDPRDEHQAALAWRPTILDAEYQIREGVDGFGRKLGPEKSPYDQKPDSETVSATNHGRVEHRIARWLNSVSGGNMALKGAVDIEPGTIKNLEGIVGGGLGRFVGDVINLGYLGAIDAPINTRDIPIYKAFYGEYDSKSGMSLFYDRSKEAKKEFADMKAQAKIGIQPKYSDEKKFLQGMGAYAENISEMMGDLKKEEVKIAESNSTDKEKELKRRMVQKKREKMAEDFNTDWYKKESKLKRKS
jgi:hypothetical protein